MKLIDIPITFDSATGFPVARYSNPAMPGPGYKRAAQSRLADLAQRAVRGVGVSKARSNAAEYFIDALTPGSSENEAVISRSMELDLIQGNNSKIEKSFPGVRSGVFSIPAGLTCPGAGSCSLLCYAEVGRFGALASWQLKAAKWFASVQDAFVDRVVSQVQRENIEVVRVHDSGDFYSVAYVMKWVEIARKAPNTLFYGYTKSVSQMKTAEKKVGGFPENFRFVYSWGSQPEQWKLVNPEQGDRIALIVCAPDDGSPFKAVKEHANVLIAGLLKSNITHKLKSVGVDAPLFIDGTTTDYPAAFAQEQFVLLGWHGGSRQELEGVGFKNDLQHAVPMTLQRWTGKSWTAPKKAR